MKITAVHDTDPDHKADRLTSYIKFSEHLFLTNPSNPTHHMTIITGACQEIVYSFARLLHL